MEISNPGGLFGPITEERLGEQGLQATRNIYLMKILEDLQVPNEKGVLCENRGTGIIAMISALTKIGMGPPLFRDYRSSFNVTCFNNTLFNKQNIHETNKIKKIRSKGDEIMEFWKSVV